MPRREAIVNFALVGAATVGVAAIISGCVAGDVPEVSADDPQLVTGRDVYAKQCARCHGADGGGGIGKKLNDGSATTKYPDPAAMVELMVDGQGQMPSFAKTLTPAEIDAVIRYVREVL